jgi:hypothetical protein
MTTSTWPRALAAVLVLPILAHAEPPEPAPNTWVRLEKADIPGQRWDVPLGYTPGLKRFLVLGGRTSWGEYRKGIRPYDQLALDREEGRWENWFPRDKEWGPRFGPARAPSWKDERWGFRDAEGNIRPNWSVYGTFSLGAKYDYDPDTKTFVFSARGHTFRYDPAERAWTDLAPKSDPEKELGGILLWSSMCYDRHNKRFVLFGGGNVQSERGDPGTWVYTPASNAWQQLAPERQPPQRANSRLVYDPVAKKVVLFGGDALDRLLADTWVFDVVTGKWEERTPPISPSPRGGHALLWLAKARKVLLLGGYGYTSATGYVEGLYRRLPFEAWTYDVAADTWELVKHFEAAKSAPEGPANFFLSAAVDENDTVLVLDFRNQAWLCRFDVSRPDKEGTAKFGAKPGTLERRTGPHDPAWYKSEIPAANPAGVAERLKRLPGNTWVVMPTPKLPRPNMDWGSAVFDTQRDLILRFSGGHSAYSGTAPQIYDVKTDRYSIPFAPEYPLEYVYSNDQVGGEWSFRGNPWMTGHTYKSTGYDLNLKALVFAPHEYSYFFDPETGKWSRSPGRNPYRPDFYLVTVCATPDGAVAWADRREGSAGLWRLDARARAWKPLPLRGELPAKSPDRHGMAYDSKRGRLLLFSDIGKRKGNVAAYDLRSGEAKWLDPAGAGRALVPCRETVYVPDADLVLIGGRVKADGGWRWLAYDCGRNAWVGIELSGEDPVGRFGAFNNSMGLMYDPARKLIWAVGQNSQVHALRLDMKSAKIENLK